MRPSLVAILTLTQVACGEPHRPAGGAPTPAGGRTVQAAPARVAARLPDPDEQERFLQASHLRAVSGDIEGARRVLRDLAFSAAHSPSLRARAALRLAEIAEIAGDRRQALSYLDQAKSLAGTGHALALEADDRRARILTAAPLADVRGPVPGSVPLKGEPPHVAAAFRRAETLLGSYHRIVVAPSLENINEVLRTKRRALAAAVAEYQKVASSGGPAPQVAALFRIGAMYHHLAEAIAFESPAELLPSVAVRLRRELRGESAGYLRRALGFYRSAADVKPPVAADPWRVLAKREAETLGLVLGKTRKPGR